MGVSTFEEYIDEGIVELASKGISSEAETRFTDAFGTLKRVFGENALRRHDDGRHVGRVGLVAFECTAVGIAKNIANIRKLSDPDGFVLSKVQSFWSQPELQGFMSQGMRGTNRIQRTVPFGETWFRP